jgi:phytoene/squalene synthetase
MQRYGISESHLRDRISDTAMQQLIQLQVQRASALLLAGAPLGNQLPGRMGFELRLIIQGGMRILQKLHNNGGEVFRRPRLRESDYFVMCWHALIKSSVVVSD